MLRDGRQVSFLRQTISVNGLSPFKMSASGALFGHRSDDDEGLLLGAKRTCRLSFSQVSELSVPLDRELLKEIVEFEGRRLPAFENSFDQGR